MDFKDDVVSVTKCQHWNTWEWRHSLVSPLELVEWDC